MVTVRVGTKEPKDFHIHKQRLCQYSPFFKGALDKDWSEAKSNVIELPDDTVEIFEIYCDWLYNISPFRESASPSVQHAAQSLDAFRLESTRYYEAYMFGDKVLDVAFTDMLIDNLVMHMNSCALYPVFQLFKIFQLSASGHPVRQLLIDVVLYDGQERWLEKACWNDVDNREAILEITKALVRQKGKLVNKADAPYLKTNICRYHSHTGTDTPCYKTQRGWGWLREQDKA